MTIFIFIAQFQCINCPAWGPDDAPSIGACYTHVECALHAISAIHACM